MLDQEAGERHRPALVRHRRAEHHPTVDLGHVPKPAENISAELTPRSAGAGSGGKPVPIAIATPGARRNIPIDLFF